ncbi:N-acetylmuramoyl-L-alanine amidase [Aquabacterium sp.]|uniref:N-acetylmuramoyl-L-alanine amidase n=1 Tax=Aquabacterium sp. TaxID=1872578 RepID=UPI00403817B4
MPQSLTHITVHCSATKPSVYVDRAVIDRWHRAKGWLGIGYHFVIKRDGTVEAGRSLDKVGAHVEGHNTGNIGVCLAGGLNEKTAASEDNYTPEQKNSLAKLLKTLTAQYGIPKANVLGHRDWPGVAKDCPCFDVKPWAAKVLG